jgi:long-subunit acyl-CoA synthetase (AMP-forming)
MRRYNTYTELEARMSDFSRGLANRGVQPTHRVALFAEASSRWLIADGGRAQQMLLATSSDGI